MPRPATWNRQEWRAWHAGDDGPGSPAALALPVLAAVAGSETGRWPQHDLDALKAIALLRQVRREVDDETQGWLLIARGRGLPWEAIAEALGVTPQAARAVGDYDMDPLWGTGAVAVACRGRSFGAASRRRTYARACPEGGVVADFVRYELEDGSEVYFESAEGSLVALRGGEVEAEDAGKLGDRLRSISVAAGEISEGLRERLAPDELEVSFGVKVSGEVNWWFIAKADGEASIQVKATWKADPKGAARTAATEPSP